MSSKPNYNLLCKASLSANYLHTNSTTHEFLFGALAELIDNSRDAGANHLFIYTEVPRSVRVRGEYTICFLDDGQGMSPEEAKHVVTFGYSEKKNQNLDLIGQYGNGLKSGSMRLGSDLIMITKKDNVITVLLLSRQFYSDANITEVLICLPCFDATNKKPIYYKQENGKDNIDRFELEMDLIFKYSPFKNKAELEAQFDKIKSESGTLCNIFNLKLNEDGETELDIETDPEDILMRKNDIENFKMIIPEKKSLRAYVSILYFNPKMKIYIQSKKVKTKMFHQTLFKPLRYVFKSKIFKSRSIAEKDEAEKRLKSAEANKKEILSKYEDYIKKYDRKNNQQAAEYARLVRLREDIYNEVETEKLNLEKKTRAVNNEKGLEFIFGINLNNRDADGLFIYNSNRLILMSEPTRMQRMSPKSEYRGLVGIVNVPYLVLEPTHNKQKFANEVEQKKLVDKMSDYMEQYLFECAQLIDKTFWKKFGYLDDSSHLPIDDHPYNRVRLGSANIYAQCDECLKWRQLVLHERYLISGIVADNWVCIQNPEPTRNSCKFIESLAKIELREYDKTRLIVKRDREREKQRERLEKMKKIKESNDKDFNYGNEDDDEHLSQSSINNKSSSSVVNLKHPAATAKNFYASLKTIQPPPPPPPAAQQQQQLNASILKSNNSTVNNESSIMNQSKLKTKRIRIADETDSDESLDLTYNSIINKKKKKSSSDDPPFNPSRPNQLNNNNQISKKSTSLKTNSTSTSTAKHIPRIVNEYAENNDDDSDDDSENVNNNYRNALNDYSKVGKVKPEPISNNSTLLSSTRLTNGSLLGNNLVQRDEEVPNNEEESISNDETREIISHHCEVLRNIAVLVKDNEIVNQIDTFEEKSQVANFPYKVLLNNLEETIKLKQKQKVEKAMRIERQRIEENLQSLQNKLLRDLKYSNLTETSLKAAFDELIKSNNSLDELV